MTRAAVIGAGTMGNGIAHVFAQHGWEVALVDSAPAALDQATATIRGNLDRQVKKGTIPAEAPAEILARVKTGVERFIDVFGAARNGQVILFDYIPDAGMRIFVDDRPAGQLAGMEFNGVLLSIWLGEKAPRDFREALLTKIGGE